MKQSVQKERNKQFRFNLKCLKIFLSLQKWNKEWVKMREWKEEIVKKKMNKIEITMRSEKKRKKRVKK